MNSCPQLLASEPRWLRLARRIADRSARSPLYRRNLDHLESAAFLGLWEAANAWDGRGTFEGYAACVIHRRVLDAKRQLRRLGLTGTSTITRQGQPLELSSLSDPVEDGLTVADSIESGDLPVGWEVESEDSVRSLVGNLSSRDQELLIDFYLVACHGKVDRARRMHTKTGTIYQWTKQARDRLIRSRQTA